MRGKVLAGGADWVTKGADDVLRLDLRITPRKPTTER